MNSAVTDINRHPVPDPPHHAAIGGATGSVGGASPAPAGGLVTKIVLNGAGSVEFTKDLLADLLSFQGLAGATIALFDVDSERLETAAAIARWTVAAVGGAATIEAHRDRR